MTHVCFPNAGRWPDAFRTSTYDPRFSYCCYLPSNPNRQNIKLMIAVHGSIRQAMDYRNEFSAFAEKTNHVVLAPLFPISPFGDGNEDGYKYIIERNLRYDLLLLSMIGDLESRTGCTFPKFKLFGFSGGGHFVHRFFYLHPKRVSALSIGAPGAVTLIDDSKDWWLGTRDIEARFGCKLDMAAMRDTPVQMLVGSKDTDRFGHNENSPYYRKEALAYGSNRPERLATLQKNFVDHGISVEKMVVDGVSHDGLKVVPTVAAFFRATDS